MKLCSCQRTRLRLALTAKMKPEGILAFESLILAALEDGCVCPVQASEYDEAKANSTILGKPDNSSCGVCADCPPNCFTEKKDLLGTDLEYEVARTVVRIENDLAYLKDQVDMQPKSPCEHAWRTLSTFDVANNATGGMDVYFTPEVVSLFGCQKCGLVTCKNPNE